MKPKTTIILLVLLLVCIAVALFSSDLFKSAGPEDKQGADEKLFDPDVAKPAKLAIEYPGRKVVFERTGDHWRIVEPIQAKAIDWRVNDVADALKGLRGLVAEDVSDEITGLDKPAATITVVDDKNVTHKLIVGKPRPMHKDQTYVRPAGAKQVFIAKVDFSNKIDKPLRDFRDETILDLDKDKIARYGVVGRENYELVKRKGEWGVVRPISAPADEDKVKDVLGKIARLTVSEFVTDEPASYGRYGLDKPVLVARVEMQPDQPATSPSTTKPTTAPAKPGKKHALALGAQVKDKRYGRLLDAPTVFKVDASLLNDLQPSLNDLRDKKVMRIEAGEIAAADLQLPTGKASLVKKDGQWQITAPHEGKADRDAVQKLLDKLAGLQATTFRDDVPALGAYGLDKPAATITLRLAGKGEAAKLLIGGKSPTGEMTFVKSAAALAVAVVTSGNVQDLLAAPASYWDRTLYKLPGDTKVHHMQIRRTDGTFDLVRDANDAWQLTSPLAAPAHTDQVNKAIDRLADLTADKIVALGADVPAKYAEAAAIMQVLFTTRTQPATKPATQPASPKPAATRPAATKPAATKPAATKPAATKPAPKPISRSHTLTVAKVGLHSYAWLAGQKLLAVGEFAPSLYDDLAGEFRDRKVWKITPDSIRNVRIDAGEDSLELRKEKKDVWRYATDSFVKIDAEKVASFLKDIEEIKAGKFVRHKTGDLAKYGLDKPWLRLELTDEAGKKSTLTLSHKGATDTKDRYAAASTVEGVFVVAAELLEKVGKKLKDFQK